MTFIRGSGSVAAAADFAAGLGRLNFAALALVYERPFLGILYMWSSTIGYSTQFQARVPWACRMVLHWIAKRIGQDLGRLQPSSSIARTPTSSGPMELFRSDAKATEKGAWIGGWEYKGGIPAKQARWFAFEVDPIIFPWLFIKKDLMRIIAGLELLGTIICVMCFGGNGQYEGVLAGSTDNQSNTFSVRKLLSTKYPLTILLMELSEQLRTREATLSLKWLERESNQEADDLTNCCFDKFSLERRIEIDQSRLEFLVLADINVASAELYQDLLKEKGATPGSRATATASRTKAQDRLRWRDPW